MNAARQFMFEKDFGGPDTDAQEEAAAEEAEIEEPEADLFTEEEVEAARSAGFEKGRAEAEAEFRASAESEVLNLVRDIAQNLTQISAIQERENAKRTGEAVTVASAVCRKIIPGLFEKNGADEVLLQVRRSVQNLNAAPRVVLTVAPALREAVAARIGNISAGAGYDGRIEVLEDESLAAGDCLMSWGDGGSERRLADVWDQMDAVILGGAEKVAKSVEKAYSRDADAESDSALLHADREKAAQPAPPAPGGPAPEPAPPAAAAKAAEKAAEPPQPSDISEKTGAAAAETPAPPAPPPAPAPAPAPAPEAAAADAPSDEGNLGAIMPESEIEPGDPAPAAELAPPPGEPAPPPPKARAEPAAPPPAEERTSAPAPKLDGLGITLDTSEPGGDVDDALDRALGVLSGAQKPDADGPDGPGGPEAARPAPESDGEENVFGEIVDDALDIALGALSKKKKKGA